MRILLLASLLALALGQEAQAWGQEGHSIVAELAQRRLTPTARSKIMEILGGDVSMASVASWADNVRDGFPKSYNWHFVDIPLGGYNYDPNRDCKDTSRGDCIINAIERSKRILANEMVDRKERKEALKYLIHFVGDVHQPLHTVLEYVGGNTFPVTFFVDPGRSRKEKTNLHIVWDSGVIRSTVWDWGAYVERLEEKWLPGKDTMKLSGGTPVDWALDAHQIAINVAFKAEMDGDLGDEYLQSARPMVDQQLALAGLRLARLLNEVLR